MMSGEIVNIHLSLTKTAGNMGSFVFLPGRGSHFRLRYGMLGHTEQQQKNGTLSHSLRSRRWNKWLTLAKGVIRLGMTAKLSIYCTRVPSSHRHGPTRHHTGDVALTWEQYLCLHPVNISQSHHPIRSRLMEPCGTVHTHTHQQHWWRLERW